MNFYLPLKKSLEPMLLGFTFSIGISLIAQVVKRLFMGYWRSVRRVDQLICCIASVVYQQNICPHLFGFQLSVPP
jgi:hypothetical protein